MTKIKLCGMMRQEDIREANVLEPDMIGMIFAPRRKRTITHEQAALLKETLAPGIAAVGVFLNNPEEEILELAAAGIPDMIQLHGQESPEFIQRIREKTGLPVIKAFRVDGPEDIQRANESPADTILLDSGIGGTGTTFGWELLAGVTRPYILAGGLGIENIEEAVKTLHPMGVDVSSGIETEGKKDSAKMHRFVELVRKADSEV